jgi:hypothetical protein
MIVKTTYTQLNFCSEQLLTCQEEVDSKSAESNSEGARQYQYGTQRASHKEQGSIEGGEEVNRKNAAQKAERKNTC